LSATASVAIQPDTASLTFLTDPPGLEVAVYGSAEGTPLVRDAIIGALVGIAAPSPQLSGGVSYVFDSWSDGGAISHEITVSAAPATYTAIFVPGGSYVRGDVNLDGTLNLADAIAELNFLFSAGSAACLDAADVNDDGALNIADAVYSLTYQFSGGAPPPPPFGPVPFGCGIDTTPDAGGSDLGCAGASAGCP
jgi:hypothetical protein